MGGAYGGTGYGGDYGTAGTNGTGGGSYGGYGNEKESGSPFNDPSSVLQSRGNSVIDNYSVGTSNMTPNEKRMAMGAGGSSGLGLVGLGGTTSGGNSGLGLSGMAGHGGIGAGATGPGGSTIVPLEVDQRLDPGAAMYMRMDHSDSRKSLQDNFDYSRKVLRVTNPDYAKRNSMESFR